MSLLDLAAMQARVLQAPFHRWLGLRVTAVGDGTVTVVMPWRPEIVSDPGVGYTHGGILATLVDLAGDYAIATRLGRGVPTVDMRVDYHRVAVGGDLTAQGSVIRLGRTLATAEGRILDADGNLLASGRGVYLTQAR